MMTLSPEKNKNIFAKRWIYSCEWCTRADNKIIDHFHQPMKGGDYHGQEESQEEKELEEEEVTTSDAAGGWLAVMQTALCFARRNQTNG